MPIETTLHFKRTPAGIVEAHLELDQFATESWGEEWFDAASEQLTPAQKAWATGRARGDTGSEAALTAFAARRRNKVAELPAVTVYRNAETGGESQRLLELLPGGIGAALTPTELGELLPPNEDGSARKPANVRAVLRNIKRNERKRKSEGEMSEDGEVVKVDRSRYEAEGCNRYYLTPADREAIDAYRERTNNGR